MPIEHVIAAISKWRKAKQEADIAWKNWIDRQNELVRKHGGCVKSNTGFYYRENGVRSVSAKGNKQAHPDGNECERMYDSMEEYGNKIAYAAQNMRLEFQKEFGDDVIRVISV